MEGSTRQLNITPEEIEQGKTMAVVAYIIFFIPLLMEDMRKNKFGMFHTEQAIIIFASYIVIVILSIILGIILASVTCGIGTCGTSLLYLIPLALTILGIINAATGKVKELPVVGQFGEKFNLVK